MAQKKQIKKVQKKKKKWCTLTAPNIFRNTALGETPVFEEEHVLGRRLKMNLMTLNRDPKKQNINITFKVNDVKNYSATTEVVAYELMPSSIKRFVKRKKEKIEDSFLVKTKDDVKVRIKPIIVTNGKTANSVVTAIRKKVRHYVGKKLEKMKYQDYVTELVQGKFQMKLKGEIKKLYPSRAVEIRKSLVETRNYKPINPDDYKIDIKKVKEEIKEQEE